MATYANQKRIIIEPLGQIEYKGQEKKEGQPEKQFLKALLWDELQNVMTDLTPPEFMLWTYLQKWRGKGYYDFSPADLKILFGWADNSARKYKNGLEMKGYLIKKSNNKYHFIAYPNSVTARAALIREKNREQLQ